MKCDLELRKQAGQDTSPWRCQQCGRGRDVVAPAPDGKICIPCVRKAAQAAA